MGVETQGKGRQSLTSRLVSPKTVTHSIEGTFHKRFPYLISTLYLP